MSWNMAVSDVAAKTAEAQLDAAEVTIGEFGHKEMMAQLKVAKAAVVALLASGALGKDPSARYHVSMYGHANPGHAITQGWATDSISVGVTMLLPGVPNASGEPVVEKPEETQKAAE